MNDRNWRDRALCKGIARADYDPWFPTAEPGTPVYLRERGEALDVCALCPVRAQCLDWALDALPEGIAGGLDEFERARLRRAAA